MSKAIDISSLICGAILHVCIKRHSLPRSSSLLCNIFITRVPYRHFDELSLNNFSASLFKLWHNQAPETYLYKITNRNIMPRAHWCWWVNDGFGRLHLRQLCVISMRRSPSLQIPKKPQWSKIVGRSCSSMIFILYFVLIFADWLLLDFALWWPIRKATLPAPSNVASTIRCSSLTGIRLLSPDRELNDISIDRAALQYWFIYFKARLMRINHLIFPARR